jgi:GDP-4-dehydro-6-deoxy-D-mannose reductase
VRAFVTGGAGFIGSYLVEFLLARGDLVTVFSRRPPLPCTSFFCGDILDEEKLSRAVSSSKPDIVFHLAAQSLPESSWIDLQDCFRVNVGGTLNVINAVKNSAPKARIIFVSSSSVYAPSVGDTPMDEDYLKGPITPYGVSKLAAEQLALLVARKLSLSCVVARPFYWIGPRKKGDVTSDWCRRIVGIERDNHGEISVGNLEITLDFIDVRDGVRALVLIAERGDDLNSYNIGSGTPTSLTNLLKLLSELSTGTFNVTEESTLVRSFDHLVRVADISKIKALGWRPTRGLRETLEETLKYWRVVPER